MMPVLRDVVSAAFAALMLVAAFEDFRRFTIPNWLVLGACALWPVLVVTTANLFGALGALACAAAAFVIGALLFSRGYLGGGDVKLLAVAILWVGPAATPTLLILTGILGGVLALILVSPVGTYVFAGARERLPARPTASERGASTPVPYGIAIAAAALIVILPPLFG